MRLPNATLGQHYTYKFPLQDRVEKVEGLREIGLLFEQSTGSVIGTPIHVGDFILRVYSRAPENAGEPIPAFLIVNPDPRSLWVAQPSDPTLPFAKPDSQHDTRLHAGMKAMCASQRGRAHAQTGGQREDEAQIGAIEGRDWMFAAVADGAGSAKWAREGSRLACTTVATELQRIPSASWTQLEQHIHTWTCDPTPANGTAITTYLWEMMGNVTREAIAAIRSSAAQQGSPAKDFATTLVFGLVWAMPGGGNFIATWGIGDSPAIVLNSRLEPDLLHAPEEGDFSGETHFLTDDSLLNAPETLHFRTDWRVIQDFLALVLMSDGVYDAQFETQHALLQTSAWQDRWPVIAPLFDAPDASSLLQWLDFWSLGNHDDRSIALIGPAPATIPTP